MAGKLPSRIGRYRILCELGHGGMAVLYLARAVGPAGFERLFAIKTIHDQLTRDQSFVDMFLDEARLAARIHHPNVVPVYEVGEEEGRYFIAMDYVSGETLAHTLTRSWKQKAAFPIAMALHLGESVSEALHHAHELTDARGELLNVVHRDVSPQNVMIGYDGVSRIMDFGVAKAADRLVHTRSGMHKGKVAYMAPEQVAGTAMDRRVDVFALGIVLWEAIAGRRLFKGANDFATAQRVRDCEVRSLCEFRKSVPDALDQIVRRALARDPADRFPTARAFGQELHELAIREAAILSSADVERYMKAMFPDRFAMRQEMARRATADDGFADPKSIAVQLESGSFSDLAATSEPVEPVEKSATHPELELRSPEIEARPFAPDVPVPSKRWMVLAGALSAVLAAGAVLAFYPRDGAEPAPLGPMVIDEVRLEFEVEPKEATISIDGRPVSSSLVLARSTDPLKVEVTAPGHRTYTRTVIPDRSHVLAVKLEPEVAAAPPEEAADPIRRRSKAKAKSKSRLLLKGDDL